MLIASTIILAFALLGSLIRLLRPQCDADRVIALDVVAFQLLGMTFLLAFFDERPLSLQFGLLLSLLGFISTVILARFLKPNDC